MYTDRYRFKLEPEALAHARRSALADLAFDCRKKLSALWKLFDHRAAILTGLRALDDSASRAIFRNLLIYRYLTPHFSRIAHNRIMHRELESFMQGKLTPREPLEEQLDLLGETVAIWEADYQGARLQFASTKYALYWVLKSTQYYFHRGNIANAPQSGDVVLDCGAFLGETALKFAVDVGDQGRIFSFDPFPKHAALARRMIARNGLTKRIDFYCCGVSRASTSGIEDMLGHPETIVQPLVSPGRQLDVDDPCVSIDDFCQFRGVSKVDYIKMDIEGSEMAALDGAHQTILRCKPKLAVCVYHKPSDLWIIPAEVKRRYPFYKLFLEHHSLHGEETVLYATACQ